MRRRKSDLHARVNRNLPLEFDDVRLTSYAGLELLERYLRTRRFNQLVREAFADLPRGGDFGVVVMVRVFVGLVIVGGRRLRHLASVADDPIFQRFGNVRVVPTARTLSRWLRHFTMRTVTRFQALNAAVVRQLLPTLGLRTWTVDVDGVVVSTGLQVERAARGYNPHQRKVPSYDPIMAHLAETTHILRVKNRSGNVHDGKAGLPFLRALWPQLVGLRTGGARLRFRMDGAFFPPGCAAVVAGPRRGLCHQRPVLSLAGSAALHPGQSHLGAGGARRDRLRRAGRGDALAHPRDRDHLSEEGPPPGHQELSARPV